MSTCHACPRLPRRPKLSDFGLKTNDAGDFTRPYYENHKRTSRITWMIYRLSTALWFVGFNIWLWTSYNEDGGLALVFLSHWTFIGYTVYVCIAALNLIVDRMCSCVKDDGGAMYSDDGPAESRLRHMFQWATFNIFVTAAIIVSITFWTAINVPGQVRDAEDWIYEINVHLLPAILGLLDVCFFAVPVRFLHVIYSMAYLVTYSIFTLILWAANGKLTYSFIDFGNAPGLAVVFSFVFMMFILFVHTVIWGLDRLKRYISRRRRESLLAAETNPSEALPMENSDQHRQPQENYII